MLTNEIIFNLSSPMDYILLKRKTTKKSGHINCASLDLAVCSCRQISYENPPQRKTKKTFIHLIIKVSDIIN